MEEYPLVNTVSPCENMVWSGISWRMALLEERPSHERGPTAPCEPILELTLNVLFMKEMQYE